MVAGIAVSAHLKSATGYKAWTLQPPPDQAVRVAAWDQDQGRFTFINRQSHMPTDTLRPATGKRDQNQLDVPDWPPRWIA